jgi:hypothetical protein
MCSKPATVLLRDVAFSYPHGKVSLIMIQFPTPFKFHWKDNGNQQLSSDEANGFMVTPECFSLLLQQSKRLLAVAIQLRIFGGENESRGDKQRWI